jgi:hypothetical protein
MIKNVANDVVPNGLVDFKLKNYYLRVIRAKLRQHKVVILIDFFQINTRVTFSSLGVKIVIFQKLVKAWAKTLTFGNFCVSRNQ